MYTIHTQLATPYVGGVRVVMLRVVRRAVCGAAGVPCAAVAANDDDRGPPRMSGEWNWLSGVPRARPAPAALLFLLLLLLLLPPRRAECRRPVPSSSPSEANAAAAATAMGWSRSSASPSFTAARCIGYEGGDVNC